MKKTLIAFLIFLLQVTATESYMIHQDFIEAEWKEENLPSFDELILSWNAARPENGRYLFYISIKTDDWSPWLLYASWGSDGQASFQNRALESSVKTYQDAVEIIDGKKATGFQIKIATAGTASLSQIRNLHVYMNSDAAQTQENMPDGPSVCLPVKGLSQIILPHDRARDLCSPTSTTAVVRYLLQTDQINPIVFAQKSWDSSFDIFGNWVFNVAQASAELGPTWECWVERLNGFHEIDQSLRQGVPVITSIRGPLPGSALPYTKGHLVAVIGYDPNNATILCMDPAFPSNEQTCVAYDAKEFMQAWNRRGRIAYFFRPASK